MVRAEVAALAVWAMPKLSRGAPRRGATRLERLIAPCVPIFYSQTGIFWGLCGAFWCLLVSAGAGAGLVVQFAGLWGHHPDALLFPPLICPTPQAPQHPHSTA